MKIKFKKPYVFEGVEYTSLELDLDRVTGAVIEDISTRLTSEGVMVIAPGLSQPFARHVAVIASGKPHQFFSSMPAGTYMAVTSAVQGFLNGVERDEDASGEPSGS